MTVQVEYRVPVLVTVNLDTRRVERVVVLPEGVRAPDRDCPVWTRDGQAIPDSRTALAAVTLAEAAEWPAWEFGF